jgi:NTP pyrophosphatase (non-canonical NTP hydrolase)
MRWEKTLEDVREGLEAWRKYVSKEVRVEMEDGPWYVGLSSSVVKSDAREEESKTEWAMVEKRTRRERSDSGGDSSLWH